MRQYEVTFIVDPVLSSEEISSTSQNYVELIQSQGSEIVNVDKLGLRPLAYAIKKRTSGVYYCVEFKGDTSDVINKLELALRRDERIVRFLTVALDKYGIKYNEDKRNGLIGRKRNTEEDSEKSTKKTPASTPATTTVAAAGSAEATSSGEEE